MDDAREQLKRNMDRMIPGMEASFKSMLRARHAGRYKEAEKHRNKYDGAQQNAFRMRERFHASQQKEATARTGHKVPTMSPEAAAQIPDIVNRMERRGA